MEGCVCSSVVVTLITFTMWCLLINECVFKHTEQIRSCSVVNGIFRSDPPLPLNERTDSTEQKGVASADVFIAVEKGFSV